MATETAPNSTELTQSDTIRRYYTERDYLLSPEGILKALSAFTKATFWSISCGTVFLACIIFVLSASLYIPDSFKQSVEKQSNILCVATTAIFMVSGMCGAAPRVLYSMNIVLMVFGAFLCFMYITILLELPRYAPQCWLYADIILSAATGVLMLTIAVLSAFFCAMADIIHALHFPMVLLNTVLLTASTVVMFITVMSQPAAARPSVHLRPSSPIEQEV